MAESSPFSSYLGTNYAPSGNEVDLLKEYIESQLSSVDDLTRRIQEAKGAPAPELEARRNAHLKLIEDHSRLLSPIHRIPDEILSLIFTFCLVTTKYGPGLSRRHISVVLSHVSMLWRDLALRNPFLWSHVRVKTPPFRRINYFTRARFMMWAEKMEALKDKMRVWFDRSSPFPIYLTLTEGNAKIVSHTSQFGRQSQAFYLSVMEAICQASLRIRELRYDLYFPFLSVHAAHIFERSPESFPNLQKIVVSIHDGIPGGIMGACLARMSSGALLSAPSLRCLKVFGMWGEIGAAKAGSALHLYRSLEQLVFRADLLRAIEVSNERHELDVLRILPNLLTCELTMRPFYYTTPARVSPVQASRLTSLTLHEGPIAEGFALGLDLPALRSLHLNLFFIADAEQRSHFSDGNGILQLFLKFGPQLKSVTMHCDSVTLPALSQCLSQLGNVEWLVLRHRASQHPVSIPPTLFALSQLSTPGTCPELRSLTMDHIDNVADDLSPEATLLGFISRRRATQGNCEGDTAIRPPHHDACVEPIREVKVTFTGWERVDIRTELEGRGLDLDGFRLKLVYRRQDRH